LQIIYEIMALSILILIVIIFLFPKVKKSIGKAIYKNNIRSANKEVQRLINIPVIFETSAEVNEIIEAIIAEIIPAREKPTGFKSIIYISSLSQNRITFAKGNKMVPKSFEVVIDFNSNEQFNICEFKITLWTEIDGIISSKIELIKLRKKVITAFLKIDSKGKITGN